MKKKSSTHRCEYFWEHLLHCIVPSTRQSQQLVSFNSVRESHNHHPPHHQFLLGINPS